MPWFVARSVMWIFRLSGMGLESWGGCWGFGDLGRCFPDIFGYACFGGLLSVWCRISLFSGFQVC